MKKILVYGGLGNQMFQYALNVSLNKKGIKSRISVSDFFRYHHHNGFDLPRAFDLKLQFPLNLYAFLLKHGNFVLKNKGLTYLLRSIISTYYKFIPIYKEKKAFVYDDDIFNNKSEVLWGIWQVEEYFKDISVTIFKVFTFIVPNDKKNQDLTKAINESNSVSVHIRRGDYLNPEWAEGHAVIKNTNYYERAITYLKERESNLKFFIFSDDILWVKENLNIPNCVYIDHNKGKSSYCDMYLMSICKHNIIANSTFSWWGAWLNKNINKIVIMPNHWLTNDSAKGIFPDNWIKMDV